MIGVIWKAVSLALKSRQLPTAAWQRVLPDALHSIRTLLCTATNETPHERMLAFQRRSSNGDSVPTRLSTPGRVLLKRHVRESKYDPLVDEVELLDVNPSTRMFGFRVVGKRLCHYVISRPVVMST